MSANWKDFVKAAKESRDVVHRNPVTGLGYDKNWLPVIDFSKLPPVQKGTDSNHSVMGAAPDRPKVDYRMLREQLASGGNGNPDEMLGKRMNPILIAPGMAMGGVPETFMSALKQVVLANLIQHGTENLSDTNPTVAKAIAAANVGMTAAPMVRPAWNWFVKKAPNVKEIPNRFREWRNRKYLFGIKPEDADKLDMSTLFAAARRKPNTVKEKIETLMARRFLSGEQSPKDLSDLRWGMQSFSESPYDYGSKQNSQLANRMLDSWLYPKKQKYVSFNEMLESLPDGREMVFKGNAGGGPVEFQGDTPYWFTHNPAVGAGYSGRGGWFSAYPVKPGKYGLVSSRFTPHIASANKADIASAQKGVSGGFGNRTAGRSHAGDAYDYEAVLTGSDISEALGRPIHFRTVPTRMHVNLPDDELPVLHGVDATSTFDPRIRFSRIKGPEDVYPNPKTIPFLMHYLDTAIRDRNRGVSFN